MGSRPHPTDPATEPRGGFGSIRWLTPVAGLIAAAALVSGSHPYTSMLACAVIGLAVVLELAGWHRAVRSHGRRLAIAAFAGALSMAALIGWVQWKRVDGVASRSGQVAARSVR